MKQTKNATLIKLRAAFAQKMAEKEKLSENKAWWTLSLNEVYKRLWYSHFKGDVDDITFHTINVLLKSEIPVYFFTFLDIIKLKSLFKYRLHYKEEIVEHLGIRNYPPNSLTWKATKVAMRNYYLAYVLPTYLLLKLGNYFGVHAYDTEEDEKKVTWFRLVKETIIIAIMADFFFYALHRTLHFPQFYQKYHKMHHEFKYTIAMTHHWATFSEALLFFFPQVLPPLIYWGVTGTKAHITSLWVGMLFTQLNGTLGHAGYRLPFFPSWLPSFQASYHDYHHVDYKANYAANFPITDMIFGTYYNAPMEYDIKRVMQNKRKETRFMM